MAVGRVRTGLILIGLGLLFLLDTTGVMEFSFWNAMRKLWPVILIAIGVEKLFSATTNLKPLAYISPVLIVALFAYAVIANDYESDWGYYSGTDRGRQSDIYNWSEEKSSGIEILSLKVDKAGGRLVVRNGADDESLLDGRLRYWGKKPRISSETDGVSKVVEIRDRGNNVHSRDVWQLKVSEDIPVTMDIDGGAARMRLDFSRIRLKDLTLDAGAVDIDLAFGTLASVVNCAIECGAATLDITIPMDAGLSIQRESALSHFSASGLSLVERGSRMETPGFESEGVKIHLNIDSGLSSLRVHRAEWPDDDSSI